MKTITGYHFTGPTLRNGDPIPPVGKWLQYRGPVVPCKSGLHASEHPFDALKYAPGNLLHRVELRGDLQTHGDPVDKWVGSQRRILASIYAEFLLREFARWAALSVIHLWQAPDVVARYLRTGDETLRAAARAAGAAARAARTAGWTAAMDAARAAGTDAARTPAMDAARTAATDAARAAGTDAARTAARDAARDKFLKMVEDAFIQHAKETKP